MVDPIHSSQPAYHHQDPQEKHKMFELQWEISILGTYLAVTRQNGHLGAMSSKIKNDIKSGMPAANIAQNMNDLIDQINLKIPADHEPFPSFSFSQDRTSKIESLKFYALTFEKIAFTLKEKGHLNPDREASFWKEAHSVFNSLSQMPNPEEVFKKLDALIDSVNRKLPRDLEIPSLPRSLLSSEGRR